MTWYRYCHCAKASFPEKDWKTRTVADAVDWNGNPVERTVYSCRRCRKHEGQLHVCPSVKHPIEDEIFGPQGPVAMLLATGWDRPSTWKKRLKLVCRTTLLDLANEKLLESYVYKAIGDSRYVTHFRRAYRPAAGVALEDLEAAVQRIEAAERGTEFVVVDKGIAQSLLEDAEVPYRERRRGAGLLAPAWAAPLITVEPEPTAFAEEDKRPKWQKRRLFRLAALAWAKGDAERREALEALMMANDVASAQRLAAAHVQVPLGMPYKRVRPGERTRRAIRKRQEAANRKPRRRADDESRCSGTD